MNATKNDHETGRLRIALAAEDWSLLTRLCRQALRKSGRNLPAHRLLGYALLRQRRIDEATTVFSQALAQWPTDAELLLNFSKLYLEQALPANALPMLETACRVRPGDAICWITLSQCCYAIGKHDTGFSASQTALALASTDGDRVAALLQSAIQRRELGQVREAVEDCDAAIALQPGNPRSYTNKQLFLLADHDTHALANAARHFAAVFENPRRPQWPDFATRDRHPWRRLKIGFVSPDFRDHAVMYFVEGLLAQLDRRQFEVFAFFLYPRGDAITERVRCHADHFVHLTSESPEDQASAIRAHDIDIAIDLAGHTGHNGLLALACKPAPVQVSWLGFPGTTGLTSIDYRFTDDVTDPPDAQEQYSEQLYRLPTFFCCYRPLLRHPLWRYQPAYTVRPTPALNNGYVTFGSCNNLGKLTDEVLALWGQVMQAVPRSHLLIEGKNLGNEAFANSYRERCAALGIDTARLDLVGLDHANQYLTYHRIDLVLDPFPLTGGTTTLDALWMGVPLVSMKGASFNSRLSTGALTYLGRTEWLAETHAEYVQIAQGLAGDVHALDALRATGRPLLERSALMREDIHNHCFGEGLRAMWLQWLAKSCAPHDEPAQQNAIEGWLKDMPVAWAQAAPVGVGLAPGRRVNLPEAYQHLQELLEGAKEQGPASDVDATSHQRARWLQASDLAETLLNAVPHDPVALACLAEAELAFGSADLADTYLHHAARSLANHTAN